MVDAVSHVGVWVDDQDAALAFYTGILGFEVRADVTLDELDGYRWLTVGPPGQPDLSVILSRPGPPAMDAATAERVLELVAAGAMGGGIFRSDDCRADCRELEARGAVLFQQPEERFYGVDASLRDPAGNLWRIVQRTGDRP